MHKKFEINQTKVKGGCQSGRKVVPYGSKSDVPIDGETHILIRNKHEISICESCDISKLCSDACRVHVDCRDPRAPFSIQGYKRNRVGR